MSTMKRTTLRLHRTKTTRRQEKLPWPGLKAKDHLTRVVTRAVKEAWETRESFRGEQSARTSSRRTLPQ